MTLMDIADKAGLTLSVYHRIEIGQREIYESELVSIARALGMEVKDVLTRIYEMKEDGSLERALSLEVDPMDSIAKINDILKTTESVYTPSGVFKFQKVLVYSKTLANGNMLVDKASEDYAVYPMSDKKEGLYAVELSSRRLGSNIPVRSILFIDPNQAVRGGDMAAQVVQDSGGRREIRLMVVKEDIDGKFYGLQYNPDERVALSAKELAGLQRIILISMN